MKHIMIAILMLTFSHKIMADQKKALAKDHGYDTDRSAFFVKLKDKSIVYEENKNLSLIPASTTKLLLAITALDLFGPYKNFLTNIYYTGKREKAKIDGDMIIVGSGDPLIINEKLWQMAADFKHMNISQISGNIIIDNSLFDGEKRDPSRKNQTNRSSNAYDAPVSAFGVNFNTFPIAISPAQQNNYVANINIDPYPINGIELANQTKTNLSSDSKLRATRISDRSVDKIIVSGLIGKNAPLKKLYRSVKNPELISGETIRSFLKAEGIEIKGKVLAGRLPDNAKKLYTIEGFPVSRMIQGLNKFSNNYIADVLTKKLGATFNHSQIGQSSMVKGSFSSGTAVIANYMRRNIGITGDFNIENGSGLDSRNRLSTNQLTKALLYAQDHINFFPDLLASLPLSGVDGTLKKRFLSKKTAILKGRIRGKTGTLSSPITVSSISGYLQHEKQGLIAFTIIENGKIKKPQPGVYTLQKSHENLIYRLWQDLDR
jgi:D-alanyl-D-alanine carboxypeptidase/D-alanyl-D-alanine-endopeptidase (penicillin-binding protein 4)